MTTATPTAHREHPVVTSARQNRAEDVQLKIADKIDPGNAILELAQGDHTTLSIIILAVWVGMALLAGTVMNGRRAVQ